MKIRSAWSARPVVAACVLAVVVTLLSAPVAGQGRGGRGGGGAGGRGGGPPAPTTVIGQVKFVKGANVHATPLTAAIVLVTVPVGLVLNIYEHRGPWFAVELTPDLRQKATPMRWYRNETRGFVHESTVEMVSAVR